MLWAGGVASANPSYSSPHRACGAYRGTSSSKASGRRGRASGCGEAGGVASANPSYSGLLGLVTSHEANLRRP
jgi:hypothetical protein